MVESEGKKFLPSGRVRLASPMSRRGAVRPPSPKLKKERPASKGRVHKGRTRD